MRRLILACATTLALTLATILAATLPGGAGTGATVQDLYDALGMSEVVSVMRVEGLAYGEELRAEMFPGRGGDAWSGIVARIYDPEAMDTLVQARFDALMDGVALEPLVGFFRTPEGRKIVRLELEARRAMMDKAVEAAAKETFARMQSEADPRLDLIDRFVAANDLVDSNVVGAMNSNYAFYLGLMEGGAVADDMDESQILSDVWSQEPEIRADTLEWVYSYLALAYQPLSDAEIEAYIALSRTDEGRALNQAVFGAFDTMYTAISRALGQGAAQFLQGEEL